VIKGIFACDAATWHPVEHFLNQIGCIDHILLKVGRVANDALEVSLLDVIQLVYLFNCMFAHLWGHGGELFSRWKSQNCDLLNQLAAFRFAWEDWPPREELGKDASNCPYINRVGVVTASKDQFRCPVVPRDDVGCVKPGWTENFGAAEVANFDYALRVHENIFRFEITMANALLVHKFHSEENLAHKVFNVVHWDELAGFFCILNDFFEVLVAEFKDKVLYDFAFFIF